MSKFLASLLLLLAVMAGTTTAFTTTKATIRTRPTIHVSDMPSYQAQTSTSLNLKVKVDPNAKTNNAAGNAKAAAYGGSIAIAALLPIAFLVWSALSKGN